MPDTLYEHDALAWAEDQADLLRRLAAGERVNDAIDWPHVIEEINDVGLSELRACRSLLRQALIHLLKLHVAPRDRAVAHWRSEFYVFALEAGESFAPSMRQRMRIDSLYADAVLALAPRPIDKPRIQCPATCPYTLDDLLTERPEIDALLARLREP